MKFVTEIRDPIHGYVKLTDVEKEVVDTAEFQRLRRIKQLAGAYVAYPAATHTRFEHSLGSMHLAGVVAQSLASKGYFSNDDMQLLRLAALCHDIGHGPFSHVFEEAFADKYDFTHEDITQRIVRETSLKDVLVSHGYDPTKLSNLTVGKSEEWPPFFNEVVAGGLSVDIMDYLLRDSYHTGVEYGRVDIHRLIDSFDVVDGHLALDQAALYAFEAYVIARYEMFKAVYFHKTVRAAEVMLIRAIEAAAESLGPAHRNLESYLELDDESVMARLLSLSPKAGNAAASAKQLAMDMRNRRLVKLVFERLIHRKDEFIEKVFGQKGVRREMAEEIARKANVSPEKIFVDVPTAPSVPYTSARERLVNLTIVSKTPEGVRRENLSVDDLAVVGAITGYIDVVRVYSSGDVRPAVQKATEEIFGREGFVSKISM